MQSLRLALLSTVFGVAAVSATPLGNNITIADNILPTGLLPGGLNPGSGAYNILNNGWFGNHEDNETEPGTQQGQQWDLEGMYMLNNTLSLVGGYNFQAGQAAANGHVYTSGDIFIDTDGNAQFGSVANGATHRGGTTSNTFGFDYVIHFNSGLTSYSVFNLNTAPVSLAETTDVAASNPWKYLSGGSAVSGWQNVGSMTVGTISDITPFGLLGVGANNTHYALSVDLSFLPSNTLTTFHYTMECGNDSLAGRGTTAVPDTGATVGFVLAGMLALGSARRLRIFRARAS